MTAEVASTLMRRVIHRTVSQSARKWKDTMADHSAGYPSQSIAGAKRITESRACGTRIWATSCPISRADSNLNMPTYAEHASLQWIKARRLTRPLFPQNSHVHFFPLLILLGAPATRISVYYVGIRSYALLEGLNVGLECFSPTYPR